MSSKLFFKIRNLTVALRQRLNSRFGHWLSFFVLCFIGLSALWYVGQQVELASVSETLSSLSVFQAAAVFGFVVVFVFIAALRWQVILRGFGYRESLWRLIKRSVKASTVSFLVPSFEISGETFKGLELQRHGVSVPASFASVFFDYILVLAVNLFGGLLLLLYVLSRGLFRAEWAIAGTVFVLFIFFLLLRRLFKHGTLSRFLARCIPLNEKSVEAVQLFDYGLSFFVKESRKYLVLAAGITVVGFLWELVQVFLILVFLGVQPTATQVFVFYLAIYFFNSVPVFGGLGFGEAGAFLSGSILGTADAVSLSLAILLRLRQLIILIFGGSFFMTTAIKETLARMRSRP